MVKEQSSSKMSTLASKYIQMNESEFWDIVNGHENKGQFEDAYQLYLDLKSLAASVLTQDETKGQKEITTEKEFIRNMYLDRWYDDVSGDSD